MPGIGSPLEITALNGAPLLSNAYFTSADTRKAAGQKRHESWSYYEEGVGGYRLLPLSQCFLSDGTTLAANRSTWGTLDAHWVRITDQAILGGGPFPVALIDAVVGGTYDGIRLNSLPTALNKYVVEGNSFASGSYFYLCQYVTGNPLSWTKNYAGDATPAQAPNSSELTQAQRESFPDGASKENPLALASAIASTYPFIGLQAAGQVGYNDLGLALRTATNSVLVNIGTIVISAISIRGMTLYVNGAILSVNDDSTIVFGGVARTVLTDAVIKATGTKKNALIRVVENSSTAIPSAFDSSQIRNSDIAIPIEFLATPYNSLTLINTRVAKLINVSTSVTTTVYVSGTSVVTSTEGNFNIIKI